MGGLDEGRTRLKDRWRGWGVAGHLLLPVASSDTQEKIKTLLSNTMKVIIVRTHTRTTSALCNGPMAH